MGIITIAEVLERVNEFERILAEFYANLSQTSTREGVRLLTDYMSRHRQRTLEALAKLPTKQMRHIRRIPLRYDPQGGADKHCFEGVDLPPDATAAEVLDTAIEFDEDLIRFYRHVLQHTGNREIKELFESLIRREQNDEIEMKKIKAMDYF